MSSSIVLVHGAWHGAWCWRRVLAPLWAAGHRVFPVTLTGVGERAHQLSREITLHTHIEDVARVIEAEELDQVLLVGHSYAGMVITGVADRMAARIRRLVYLDAVVPLPGESWSYASGCPLGTASGSMVGGYSMTDANGREFEAAIPAFSLDVPGDRRVLN